MAVHVREEGEGVGRGTQGCVCCAHSPPTPLATTAIPPQGARLTAYELVHDGLPATLICDSAAAALMAAGNVDAVVVGADRIAANGDTGGWVLMGSRGGAAAWQCGSSAPGSG